jgi:hypothetical protein
MLKFVDIRPTVHGYSTSDYHMFKETSYQQDTNQAAKMKSHYLTGSMSAYRGIGSSGTSKTG